MSLLEVCDGMVSVAGDDRCELQGLHRLFEQHAADVRALLRRMLGSHADLDDLTQDVFLVTWNRFGDAPDDRPSRGWLFGVAVKLAQAARRRQRVRRFFGLETVEEVADATTPFEAMARSEASALVHRLLEPMAEKKRTVFVLYELQGMSCEEISQVVGCPVPTVRTRLFHARREFEARLQRLQRTREAKGGMAA